MKRIVCILFLAGLLAGCSVPGRTGSLIVVPILTAGTTVNVMSPEVGGDVDAHGTQVSTDKAATLTPTVDVAP